MTKVLIVDDDNISRKMMKFMLEDHGFQVVGEAVNGWDGFSQYRTHKPDIVIMDVVMPSHTGFDALEWIMEYDRMANVIMMSGLPDEKYKRMALSLGSKGFVGKPVDSNILLQMMDHLK